MTLCSLLFTPGNKPERFHKAYEVGASGIILDLEDSVGPNCKEDARRHIIDYLQNPLIPNRPYLHIIRINAPGSGGLEDLEILLDANIAIDALSIPKVDHPDDLQGISSLLEKKGRSIPLIAQIESGSAITHLEDIVSSCTLLSALAFGGADYSVDLGAIPMNWESLFYARARMIFAARIRKLAVIDTPYFQFSDTKGLHEEAEKVKALGFVGKLAIHPSQIEIINEVFTPDTGEVQQAQEIVRIFEAAKGNACRLGDLMIDVPVYERAKKLLSLFKTDG